MGPARPPFESLPVPLRSWVEEQLGSRVVTAQTQVGGFSPGVAARVVCADGRRAFVKAVGSDVNSQTPDLFRHEAAVLAVLPPAPYRASMLGSYDDGTWVGLLLDDVDGAHPDLHDDAAVAAVRDALVAQARELTPDPVRLDVMDLAATIARWTRRTRRGLADDPTLFPDWFVVEQDLVLARLDSFPDRLPPETWVHFDVRDDNLLRRPDGTAVVIDWGISRPGPWWIDQVLLAVHHVDDPVFDEQVTRLVPPSDQARMPRPDDVTDFLIALGASIAALRDRPVPGIPAIDRFREREQARLLAGARRRLGL